MLTQPPGPFQQLKPQTKFMCASALSTLTSRDLNQLCPAFSQIIYHLSLTDLAVGTEIRCRTRSCGIEMQQWLH